MLFILLFSPSLCFPRSVLIFHLKFSAFCFNRQWNHCRKHCSQSHLSFFFSLSLTILLRSPRVVFLPFFPQFLPLSSHCPFLSHNISQNVSDESNWFEPNFTFTSLSHMSQSFSHFVILSLCQSPLESGRVKLFSYLISRQGWCILFITLDFI